MQKLRPAQDQIAKYVKAQDTLKHLNVFINPAKPPYPSDSSGQPATGTLSGSFVAIKDNICTRELPTSCASQALRDYRSPFDATVVERIKNAGGVVVGKTNLDEFGMGSHSVNSAFGPVHTLGALSAGGSSGGSAVVVATHQCDGALGTDTGGSVRLPAAYNGVFGFKPSYGLASRWGVVAYANSLDTVGFLARDLRTLRALFETTNAHDPKDPTSTSLPTRSRLSRLISQYSQRRGRDKMLRIGVPPSYNTTELSPLVRSAWLRTLTRLNQAGHTLHAVDLPTTQQALSAYYVLAPAEASSNLAKYDGVRYGSRTSSAPAAAKQEQSDSSPQGTGNNLFTAHRGSTFGPEVRRRILLGAYALSADAIDNYFIAAQKVRRLVQDDFDRVFSLPNVLKTEPGRQDQLKENEENGAGSIETAHESGGVDIIIAPTAPSAPPRSEAISRQSPLDAYTADVFTVPVSLAGLPAVSVPVGIEGYKEAKVGVQIIAQYGDDDLALQVAEAMDRLGLVEVTNQPPGL